MIYLDTAHLREFCERAVRLAKQSPVKAGVWFDPAASCLVVLRSDATVMPGFFHLGDFRPEASFQSISDALIAALCSLRGDEGISLAGLDPRPRREFLPIGPDALIQANAIQ